MQVDIIKIQLDENRFLFPFENENERGIILENIKKKQKIKIVYTSGKENDGRFLTFFDRDTNRQFFVYPNSSEIYEVNTLPSALLSTSRFPKTKDIKGLIEKVIKKQNENL